MASRLWREASDEQLALAARAGDRDSLGLLVARWETPLFRFAYRLVGEREEAREICQETFLRLVRQARRFRPGTRFSTWMYQIALNLCRDHLRHKRRWSRILEPPAAEPGPDRAAEMAQADTAGPQEQLERARLRQAVARALAALPPEQREVLILKEYEGLKFREIAGILGCPESTVKSRLYHGLARLREQLAAQGIGPPSSRGS